MGGKHVEPKHFRLMMDCATICEASANLQLGGSPFSARLCALCADVCHACALSCRELTAWRNAPAPAKRARKPAARWRLSKFRAPRRGRI
jgi:hypothetical protein